MLKNLFRALMCVWLAVLAACSSFSNRGTVEMPMIGSANQESFSIEKIELTDSSTVLYGVIHYRPGWWVRLASGSVIIADGVTYQMESLEGIQTDEQVTVPESGEIRFVMTYPAIPADVRSIDFSEATDNGWQLWDIDLTGEADHNMYKGSVPSRLLKETSRPMPEADIVYGDTTVVNVHLLGYKPDMGDKLRWYANTLHGQISPDVPTDVDAEGKATIKLFITAPATLEVIGLNKFASFRAGSVIVAPGETVNVYIDTHTAGIANMSVREGKDNFTRPDGYYSTLTDGVYPNLMQNVGRKYHGMQFYTGEFGDYHMNGDEYAAYIIDQYKSLNDSIDADDSMTEVGRQYSKAILMGDLIYATNNALQFLFRNYYHVNNVPFGYPVPGDSIKFELSPENVKAIAEYIDFNNKDILLNQEINGYIATSVWENAGVDPGLLKAVSLYGKAYRAAENGELEEAGVTDKLRELNGALADEVVAHDAAIRARVEALGTELMTPTPDVPADQVFDAIIAPHKGKVVMVDLWNTWCGPCRAALAANEPEKSGDLSSDDIVWIYIANQTSPNVKYLTMINDIKGIHYRVEDDQWRAITNRFGVDGIPYYILVDRQGKAEGRPDLRDHSEFKKAILAEVAK